jgi:hypothetical protein
VGKLGTEIIEETMVGQAMALTLAENRHVKDIFAMFIAT